MDPLIRITVIDREGQEHHLEAPTDMNLNLMELTKMEGLGVKGECGGMALCATCQVYVESDHALPEQSDDELDMLDQAFFVQSNSRLGCQIYLHSNLDGLKVRIAPEQD
ncbi:MAG: 2Fe-2S iron-sulfur cluster-binding protein [Bacteroidia bacterium]